MGLKQRLIAESSDVTTIDSNNKSDNIINSFSILNDKNDQLHFELIDNLPSRQNWQSVNLNESDENNITGFVSNLINSSGNVGIASQATNGLYKASANPEILMKLKDGGLGSAVMNGNKISGSAGFLEVGSKFFTPLIAFQVLSLAVGQTYMKNISLQLNSIQEKLNDILRFQHLEREVIIKVAYDDLQKLTSKKSFGINEFSIINRIIYDLSKIKLEYFTLAKEASIKVKFVKPDWKPNSKKSANKTINSYKKSGFIYNIENTMMAQNLYKLAKLVEFKMKITENDLSIQNIEEIRKLNEFEFENQTKNLYTELNEKFLENLELHKEKAIFNNVDLTTIIDNEFKSFQLFELELNKRKELIDNDYKSLTNSFISDKEIFLDFRNEVPKMYIN